MDDETIARFWSRVDRSGGSKACWPWRGSSGGDYGQFLAPDGSAHKAHRLAYELTHGSTIMPGLLACHHCDNPPCCNPAHIFIGTRQDNARDMHRKGRGYRGGNRRCENGGAP